MTTSTPTQEQAEHFGAWRTDAMTLMPYMASLLFAVKPLHCTAVQTFAIDPGLRLYINFDEVIELGPRFGAEGLLHEASHILAGHSELAELIELPEYERKTWNYAGDMAINDDLRDAGCSVLADYGILPGSVKDISGNPMPDYLAPTDYLERLRSLKESSPQPPPQSGEPSAGGQDSGSGSSPGQDDAEAGGLSEPQSPAQYRGCGTGAGGESFPGQLTDDEDVNGTAPAMTPLEVEYVRVQVAAAIEEYAQANGRGTVPGGFLEAVTEITRIKKTPWDQLLRSFITRSCKRRRGGGMQTYKKRNRRRANEVIRDENGNTLGKVIAPRYERRSPSIHVFADTSGSMSRRELGMALAVVDQVSRKLKIKGDDLLVTNVDARVHSTRRYKGISSISQFEGRGGTDMVECFRYMDSIRANPHALMIITDGETPWPQDAPKYPVAIALVRTPGGGWSSFPTPEWATVVRVGETS